MNVPLACPNAEYREKMIIYCKKTDAPCGHVFFKACKGWWALTPRAACCPLRKEDEIHDEPRKAAAGGANRI